MNETKKRYESLSTCPEKLVGRYIRTAERAAQGKFREAIKLKCYDCCGWYSRGKDSPSGCEATQCPMFQANRRIFKRD